LIWRVRDRQTMVALRRSATRVRSGVVTVTHVPAPSPSCDPPRVAFSVSRRVGGAVVRNRVRRRLRAALRELAAGSAMTSGAYLIAVQPAASERSFSQLRSDLCLSFDKLFEPREGIIGVG
jgi:ribonuclease P protein component